MRATDELKREHTEIERMLRILQAISHTLSQGEEIKSGNLDNMMEFFSVFVDKCHHGKEEEFLFPALEAAGVPREDGPIGVMLSEHAEGRALVTKLRTAANSIESGDQAALKAFQEAAGDYVILLTQHIGKENNVLFRMADLKLNPAQDATLSEAFKKLESERIGPDKHEEFELLLSQLEHEYLD